MGNFASNTAIVASLAFVVANAGCAPDRSPTESTPQLTPTRPLPATPPQPDVTRTPTPQSIASPVVVDTPLQTATVTATQAPRPVPAPTSSLKATVIPQPGVDLISIDDAVVESGASGFNIPIRVFGQDPPGLAAFDFTITFDPEVLVVTAVDRHPEMGSGATRVGLSGRVLVNGFSATSALTGDFVLLQLVVRNVCNDWLIGTGAFPAMPGFWRQPLGSPAFHPSFQGCWSTSL